uniref:Uncharacterized protein n=1 Tax=Toxoplasma gondii TgCATBr9 TaxID=943120 RepID=A0A2T6IJH4_TOXGO|nr:hypothetical protein TGBR9_384080 [Toxoplasma gondii TgCATBr9]
MRKNEEPNTSDTCRLDRRCSRHINSQCSQREEPPRPDWRGSQCCPHLFRSTGREGISHAVLRLHFQQKSSQKRSLESTSSPFSRDPVDTRNATAAKPRNSKLSRRPGTTLKQSTNANERSSFLDIRVLSETRT